MNFFFHIISTVVSRTCVSVELTGNTNSVYLCREHELFSVATFGPTATPQGEEKGLGRTSWSPKEQGLEGKGSGRGRTLVAVPSRLETCKYLEAFSITRTASSIPALKDFIVGFIKVTYGLILVYDIFN